MKDAQTIHDITRYITRTHDLSDSDKLAVALELIESIPRAFEFEDGLRKAVERERLTPAGQA
jgi:hypothetical protein